MATSVSSVTSHFPDAENGFSTTTSGSVASGATTVGLNSVAGYTNGEPVVFVIDPANSKKQTFTGIMDTSGSRVTGVIWTAGTNVAHDAGATVVDYATATHIAMISKGIKVEHNQDGTHDETLITSRSEDTSPAAGDYIITSDVSASNALKKVTLTNLFANIPNGSIVNADLSTASGELGGAWAAWDPAWTNLTEGNGTRTARYMQIGKSVLFRLSFVFGSTSSIGGTVSFALPVTASASPETNVFRIAFGNIGDAGAAVYDANATQTNTTTALVRYADDAAGGVRTDTALSSTTPMTWTTSDSIHLIGFYEAA